jgi:hypothetical protein
MFISGDNVYSNNLMEKKLTEFFYILKENSNEEYSAL